MTWLNLAEDIAEVFAELDGAVDFEDAAYRSRIRANDRRRKGTRPRGPRRPDDRWTRQPEVERARRKRWYWSKPEELRAKANTYHRANRASILPKMRARASARYAAKREEINAKRKASYHARRAVPRGAS